MPRGSVSAWHQRVGQAAEQVGLGAAAAALAISELTRLSLGGRRYELVSCHLRDLQGRIVVPGEQWIPVNPGIIRIAA